MKVLEPDDSSLQSYSELRSPNHQIQRKNKRNSSRIQASLKNSSNNGLLPSDANELILRANAPPHYSGSLKDIMQQIKAREYYNQQFQRIQEQTDMQRNTLFFSNKSPTFYESSYLNVAQQTSIKRVRVCFGIGSCAFAAIYLYEYTKGYWDANSSPYLNMSRTSVDHMALVLIAFGVIVPAFLFGILLTMTKYGQRNLEDLTATVFTVVALGMIIKKPIEKVKGPIIPLLLLLIPIFGITRMRFVKSSCIGIGILITYALTMCLMRAFLFTESGFDSFTDISYQTINYGISVIGGLVSQYRQELLRRRNFCLQLPFTGNIDADVIEETKAEKYSRHSLMRTWTLAFRSVEVEECFCRYWYLIDPYPYDNPHVASLHQGVFRTIRFAVLTSMLNQAVLLLQDIKFLEIAKDPLIDKSDFSYALILRFGITVPLYLGSALFMYVLGKAFYQKWVHESEHAKNVALSATKQEVIDMNEGVTEKNYDTFRVKRVVTAAQIKKATQDRVLELLIRKEGYVQSTQMFCSIVIAFHVACMGAILLIVSSSSRAESVGRPKPVYYMGFLNAVLFAHRSGFRVRFVYATWTTLIVAIAIISVASQMSPLYWGEYAGYVCVVLLLGMMISYEEEHLRRTFFILKSIRTLEFEEWFTVVLRIQDWVKAKMRKKLGDARNKIGTNDVPPTKKPFVVVTSAQMAQASQYGVYAQIVYLAIGIIDLITSYS